MEKPQRFARQDVSLQSCWSVAQTPSKNSQYSIQLQSFDIVPIKSKLHLKAYHWWLVHMYHYYPNNMVYKGSEKKQTVITSILP